MQELLDYFADRPSIPIPNLTVKKEIANTITITSFNVHVDQVISSFL